MKLDELAQAIRDFEERMVALGVSREAARKASIDAENVAVSDMVETQSDQRLLDLFDSIGSGPLAERQGVSARTICRKRAEAAERLYRKQIGHNVSSRLSGEAA